MIKKLDQATEFHLQSGVQLPDIQSIVEKLIDNSVEAQCTSIKIHIKSKPSFSIEVKDDGVGIDYHGLKTIGECRNVSSKIDLKGESLHSIITACSTVRITSKSNNYPLCFSTIFSNGERKSLEQAPSTTFNRSGGTSIFVEGIFNNYPVRKKQLEDHPDQYLRSVVDFLELESFKRVDVQIALVCDGIPIFDLTNSEKEQALHVRIRKRYEELTRRRNLFQIEDVKFGDLKISGIVDKSDKSAKVKIVIVNNKVHFIDSLIKKGEFFGSFVLCVSLLNNPYKNELVNIEIRNALFYSKLHDESNEIQIYSEESEQRREFAPISSSLYDKIYNRKSNDNISRGERLNITQLINKSKEINGIKALPKPQPKFLSSPKKKKLLNISLNKNQMKQLKLINQWEKKFILTTLKTEKSLLLIAVDQHAADERVRMEMIQQNILDFSQQTPGPWVQPLTKQLLSTIKVEGSKTLSLLKQKKEKLCKWYWNFNLIDEEATCGLLKLDTIPCLYIEKEAIELGFEIMMSFLTELEFDSTCWYPKRVLELIQSKACRGAIMFGDILTNEKCNQLLQQLSDCQLPFQCAHGRPTTGILTSIN